MKYKFLTFTVIYITLSYFEFKFEENQIGIGFFGNYTILY